MDSRKYTTETMEFRDLLPLKLMNARRSMGLTHKGLADLAGLTNHAIGKYESGQRIPNSEIIMKLATALGVEIGYFFSETFYPIDDITFEYRDGHRVSKSEEGALKREAQRFLEKYICIEELSNSRKDFVNPLTEMVSNEEEAEKSADLLRKKLKVGVSPINNLTDFLDRIGIKVLHTEYEDNFEGFSAWVGQIPLIVVNKLRKETTRLRFTISHELAHLVLNLKAGLTKDEIEKICNAFAGAFLVPRQILIERIGSNRKRLSLEELRGIKQIYGASIDCLLLRLRYCSIIDWGVYHELKTQDDRGYYTSEERSFRFLQLLYKLYLEEQIDKKQAQYLSNMSPEDFNNQLDRAEELSIELNGNVY